MASLAGNKRVTINMITFVVLGIALAYAMATQVLEILKDRYSVYAIFEDAGGVFTDQEVTYRGVTVGKVGAMEVVPQGVKLELLITEGIKIPEEDIEARVMFRSAVGEQFVDLLPGADGAPYLEHGSRIPLDQTSIPVSTQELLSLLEAVLRGVPPEALKGTVDSLGLALTGRGSDIATILESLADLSETFAQRAPEVEGILRSGTRVGGEFLESREDFAAALDSLVVVSDSLANSTGDLERLMRGANFTSEEVLALLRQYRRAVHKFIREFAEVNDLQADHAGDLSRMLQYLPTALERVVRTFESKTGLVRFALVEDSRNPACSYGTERRPPQDRSPRLPPKNARCSSTASSGQGGGFNSGSSSSGSDQLAGGGSGTRLPARMRDWSWTLFYLNGM